MKNVSITPQLRSGFTLVELLVVIAIIGILAGIIFPSYVMIRRQATRDAVQTDMQRIYASLENYQNDFGDYPPTHLKDLDQDLRVQNNLNNGIESLTACLMTERINGPYLEWDEKRYANTDRDGVQKNVTGWFFGNNELRELTDHWKNPIIYVHSRDYRNRKKIGQYLDRNGNRYEVQPAVNPNTDAFYSPMKYQVWSIGPNLRNENGSEDDISSW